MKFFKKYLYVRGDSSPEVLKYTQQTQSFLSSWSEWPLHPPREVVVSFKPFPSLPSCDGYTFLIACNDDLPKDTGVDGSELRSKL